MEDIFVRCTRLEILVCIVVVVKCYALGRLYEMFKAPQGRNGPKWELDPDVFKFMSHFIFLKEVDDMSCPSNPRLSCPSNVHLSSHKFYFFVSHFTHQGQKKVKDISQFR